MMQQTARLCLPVNHINRHALSKTQGKSDVANFNKRSFTTVISMKIQLCWLESLANLFICILMLLQENDIETRKL